jgi:hypothetical protein
LQSRRDPKERIKADQEDSGIVLSPQRRSFFTGCQGSNAAAAGNGQQTVSSAGFRCLNFFGGLRVNVMITFFFDFQQFQVKKLAFFLKNQFYDQIFA